MRLDLEFPIEHDGSFIRSIVLRRAVPEDFVGMQSSGPGEHAVKMLAVLGDLPEGLIDEMDASDLLAALRAVATMLQSHPR